MLRLLLFRVSVVFFSCELLRPPQPMDLTTDSNETEYQEHNM